MSPYIPEPKLSPGLHRPIFIVSIALVVFALLLIAPGITEEGEGHREPVRLLFVGDILLDRQIRQVMEARGDEYPFSCMAKRLKEYVAVIGNLEGPITPYASVSMGSTIGSPENYRFTFPTTSARLLASHNILIVNIGNNHIWNFGREGIESTQHYLAEAGVASFGAPEQNYAIYRTTFDGRPFSFVGFNEFGGLGVASTTELIRTEASEGQTTVVYAHWGEEYAPVSDRIKGFARSFVDAGAVLVVGAHPHIVLPSESYRGRMIYYSLGNFIFDQYWNEEVSRGLALEAVFHGGGLTLHELPLEMLRDGRTCFAS